MDCMMILITSISSTFQFHDYEDHSFLCILSRVGRSFVRQAKTTAGYPLILQSGFSGLRFRNQCTQALATFTFPNTLDGFVKMLREAGFSAESANMVVANITAGKYSIRQVWDLFQLRVAPRLPFVKNLLSGNSAQCWRLSQVGIGLYNAKFNTASFYFAQGNGALK